MESLEDGAANVEPPDPDIIESDPTCRYVRVIVFGWFFLIFYLLQSICWGNSECVWKMKYYLVCCKACLGFWENQQKEL